MANNRMYLRCCNCGQTLFLGKRYLSAYNLEEYDDVPFINKINKFYADHEYCRGQTGLDCFEIEYEMDKNWEDQS